MEQTPLPLVWSDVSALYVSDETRLPCGATFRGSLVLGDRRLLLEPVRVNRYMFEVDLRAAEGKAFYSREKN